MFLILACHKISKIARSGIIVVVTTIPITIRRRASGTPLFLCTSVNTGHDIIFRGKRNKPEICSDHQDTYNNKIPSVNMWNIHNQKGIP